MRKMRLIILTQITLFLCLTLFKTSSCAAFEGSCVKPSPDGLNLTSGCCNKESCCVDNCCCDQLCYEHHDCCLDIWRLDCPPEEGQPPIDPNLYTCEVVYDVEQMVGCCTGPQCRSEPKQPCYCDEECYHHQDCCVNIMEIGCKCNFTCQEHYGNISGCCVGDDCSTSCCSCDEGCYSRGDCCMDIEEWGCFVSTMAPIFCMKNVTFHEELATGFNVTWEMTAAGETVQEHCPPGKEGSLSRRCSDTGEWGEEVTITCVPKGQGRIMDNLIIIETLSAEIKVQLATNISIYASAASSDSIFHTHPNQVATVVTIMSRGIDIITSTIGEINSTEAYLETRFFDAFDNFLNDRYFTTFESIGNSTGGSSDLMVAYEKLSRYVASYEVEYSTEDESYTIHKDNIVFNNQVRTISNDISDVVFPADNDVVAGFVDISPVAVYHGKDLSEFTGDNGKVSVVNSLVKNLHRFLPNDLKGRTRMGSYILSSVVISDTHSGRLPGTLTCFTPEFINQQPQNMKCVYWDDMKYRAGESGWSTDGIEVIDSNTNFITNNITQGNITCRIYHQTPFNILFDVHGIEYNDPGEEYALEIVGFIGLGISIVFLILTILLLILMGKQLFLSVQYFIHFNLSIALLCGYLIFVFLIDDRIINLTDSKVGCAIVAGFLQYFFTAAFSWMLCEGIMLFLLLVLVFNSLSKRWYIFLFIGWGIPIIPVAISAGLIHDHYGSPGRHCWIDLDESNSAIWAFVVPILVVIVLNIFFLIMSVRALIIFHRKSKATAEETKLGYNVFKKTVVGTVVLLPLMGITWTIGLFAVDVNTTVFAWLFVCLNSLQGAFIFFFNIIRNDKIRENVVKKCCPKTVRRRKSESIRTKTSSVKRSDSFAYNEGGNRKSQEQFLMSAAPLSKKNMFESYIDEEDDDDDDDRPERKFVYLDDDYNNID